MIFESNSAEDTFAFGQKLGREAVPGEIICLDGDLGVGKTVFTQGFATRPFSTARLASRPAPMSTAGLLVLVHEVMEAMTTAPWPSW